MRTISLFGRWLPLVLVGWLAGCQSSSPAPGEITSYLEQANERMAKVASAERELHFRADRCSGPAQQQFEDKLGQLVEARVYTEEKINELAEQGIRSVAQLQAALEPHLKKVERLYTEVDKLCRNG